MKGAQIGPGLWGIQNKLRCFLAPFLVLWGVSQAVGRGWGAWQVDSYAMGCASRPGSGPSGGAWDGVTENISLRSRQFGLRSQMNSG